MKQNRIAVLISGNGSNLQALIDASQSGEIPGEIVAVISDKADAYGLQRAKDAGIATQVIAAEPGESRAQYDQRLGAELIRLNLDLVVLAGFMRILSGPLVERFAGRMFNIHPSLLPKYTGLNTHQRALDAGDSEHGCSVHFVTAELDGGPVILQAKVPIFPGDEADDLAQRVHQQEHRIYPLVVKWFCDGRLSMVDGEARMDGQALPGAGYASE
ncbi:phosphoribosylglycinamide formyltransferase [Ferrimonas gelatinilytica]|uniref:Phosphoribosylglycinamide formyltransferase n=1 Tax=Ferrimonas gelatinilytica TaxID=1255257 RepID=A0ABP9S242_9GAMM